ncbi:MAG: 23S rRNA (guanosine(2251)-2'-O)-methyltransferase RlmB [Gammaproteobacteria bacterium]|nr:23S rRNA (guanosine(2251)-2'-O)-methyltransferase RlmB [Gammaproteobacteria bacterium]
MNNKHLIYGLHAVQAALEKEPENVQQLWMEHARKDERAQKLVSLAKQGGIEINRVKREELDRLVGEVKHQGVVADFTQVPVQTESDLVSLLKGLSEPAFLLILDGVQDPHNLGACLRTADGAGVHAVIAPRDKACSLTATVRKVACGAAETVPFVQVTNLARTLRMLQQEGVWIIGTDVDAPQSLYQADLTGPIALVLGAEGTGLRRLTKEHCDSLINLPMQGSVQSLNVSVSAGVCLYESVRQRSGSSN